MRRSLRPRRYRGKRNEPAYVAATAKVLAEVERRQPRRDRARRPRNNFFRLFDKVPRR